MKMNKMILITTVFLSLIFNQVPVYCLDEYPDTYWVATSADSVTANTNNKYEIRTPQQLAWVAGVVNGTITDGNLPTKTTNFNILLMNDIDLGGKLWTPIGTPSRIFKGSFNGQNYSINNLTINTNESYQGLFGYYDASYPDEYIQNVNVIDAKINAGSQTGVIAGKNSGWIVSCHATGTVNGVEDIGGLVGVNFKFVPDGVVVIGSDIAGIHSCSANVKVSGKQGAGGLVGFNGGIIRSSFAAGDVSSNAVSSYYGLGGFVGTNYHMIENCYARGNVTSYSPFSPPHQPSIGGLVGSNMGDGTQQTKISNSYSTGEVISAILATTGGFLGFSSYSTITNCYYDNQTSNQTKAVGTGDNTNIFGKTSSDMKAFAFKSLLNNNPNDTVWIRYPKLNDGYPILKWQIENKEIDAFLENEKFLIKDISYKGTNVEIVLAVTGYENLQNCNAFLVSKDVNGKILNMSLGEVSELGEITFISELQNEIGNLELLIWDAYTLQPYTKKLRL